ncbi:MAG: hypothetical protein E6J91_52275 [Deltaproteobacteria bacterium]|nr:MAG: hypothetical protein E6J91_52275 [Deltaproteobacteria bacterium]
MRALSWIASLGVLCLWPVTAGAGLVIDLDGKIDARGIDAAEVKSDRLTTTSHGRSYTIRLPEGVGPPLLAWAHNDTGGPLVFSIDGSLVLTTGHNYSPPSVPPELARLMFGYDGYAHMVACGGTRGAQPGSHPLVQSAGESMLPYRMHRTLLDLETRTPQAIAYRRLTERFIHVPICVGELSLFAVPGSAGHVVSVQPRSWIHIITHQWYRGIDVPSEADKWVARLPYQPLKQDMETRWTAYRAAFRPLDSLSSIVEAMALLRAIKRDAPSLWTALERQPVDRWSTIRGDTELLDPHDMDRRAWLRLVYAWLGDRIETPAQANLALGLAAAGDRTMLTIEGVDDIAARDPVIAAKLQLARLLFQRDRHASLRQLADGSHQLFAQLEHVPQSFRLRATALSLIEAAAASLRQDENPMDGDVEEQEVALENELGAQETALADDFLHRAEAACRSRSPDLITWENLSQDVYSVGLLERFLGDTGRLSPRLADAVACIHIHRGLVSQQGRQLAYRHGHYRFLKYLAELTDDAATRKQILQYRRTLATAMNLHDADLGFSVQP